MTNQIFTAWTFRVAGFFLLFPLFNQLDRIFLSYYGIAFMNVVKQLIDDEFEQYYFFAWLVILLNLTIALFFILKAEWISKKIIKEEKQIVLQLDTLSLSKIIISIISITWICKAIFLIPEFIEFVLQGINEVSEPENQKAADFPIISYILRIIVPILLLINVDRIAIWISKDVKND